MKRAAIWPVIAGMFLLLAFSSCNTGYRTDIQQLLSPGALPYLKRSKLMQVSSFDSAGGNRDRTSIPPGKTITILDAEGPGMIVRLWFAVESRDPYYLRRIVMRIYWEDEEKPSVEAPLGDFFGCGFHYQPYISQYLGMTSGGFVCYFPMPFERSARIEITNDTRHEVDAFLYQVDYQKFEAALESDVAYFHASWNRSIRTDYDSNYLVLHASGKGHLVGVSLNIQSYDGRFDFMEGDEMIYVDNEKRPSIQGTGTEDYFSGGWYFRDGPFAGPFTGLVYKNDTTGQISAYRFHSQDPVPFNRNIRVTFEHGHGNQVIADYSSMAYWYQMEPHRPFPRFPRPGQRIPLRIVKPARLIEAEDLTFNLNGLASAITDMSDHGPDWGGNRQLLVEARENSAFDVMIDGLKESKYNMDLFFTRGPDYGNAVVTAGDAVAGELMGYAPVIGPEGRLRLNGLTASGGTLNLRFKVTGKDLLSKGFRVGIDGISLEPERQYIPEWNLLGPFPNPRRIGGPRRGLDTVYLPERLINLNLAYDIPGRPAIRWTKAETPEGGYVSFAGNMQPYEMVVAYAVTYILSPDARETTLFIGSDDGAKVFINGKEVYRFLGERYAEPDQAEIGLELTPGWNTLLIKVENGFGPFGFFARVADADGKLEYSSSRTLPAGSNP